MTTCARIGELIATAGTLLDIDEALRWASMMDHAERARRLSAEISETARGMIASALDKPGDAAQRVAMLNHAIELDGADSILAAQAAQEFREEAGMPKTACRVGDYLPK